MNSLHAEYALQHISSRFRRFIIALCYNIVLAATAMGYHAQWQTDWIAYDAEACAAMGLSHAERISGLVYLGTSTVPLEDRPRPDVKPLLTRWSA